MCHLIPVLITGALLELLAGLWLVSHSMGMIGLALAPRRFYVNGDGHLSNWYWGALGRNSILPGLVGWPIEDSSFVNYNQQPKVN